VYCPVIGTCIWLEGDSRNVLLSQHGSSTKAADTNFRV